MEELFWLYRSDSSRNVLTGGGGGDVYELKEFMGGGVGMDCDGWWARSGSHG